MSADLSSYELHSPVRVRFGLKSFLILIGVVAAGLGLFVQVTKEQLRRRVYLVQVHFEAEVDDAERALVDKTSHPLIDRLNGEPVSAYFYYMATHSSYRGRLAELEERVDRLAEQSDRRFTIRVRGGYITSDHGPPKTFSSTDPDFIDLFERVYDREQWASYAAGNG